MTPTEAYEELERDRENLTRWWRYRNKELIRAALKCRRFPMLNWFEWTSPRKNRYIICSYVTHRKYFKGNGVAIMAMLDTNDGVYLYESWVNSMAGGSRAIVTPHVLKRYNERAHVNKTGIELIKHFILRTGCYGPTLRHKELFGRSVRYNGEAHFCLPCSDGVVLGQKEDGVWIERTFITYDMATGRQREILEECRAEVPSLDDYTKGLLKEYQYL